MLAPCEVMPLDNLRELISVLNSAAGLRAYKRAFRESMLYKCERYGALLRESEGSVRAALEVIHIKMPMLKEAAQVDAAERADHWHIFDSISSAYRAAKDRSSQFEALLARARQRLEGTMAFDRVTSDDAAKGLRDELVAALEHLSSFAAQRHVVSQVVDVVAAFLKDPWLMRTRLLNFVMMGSAGTGKTTLAGAIGTVLAKAGIFVGDRLITAGRGELVGQYMGETVAKTRNFLMSNLDSGVVFIDEAYAITPWDEGKPESYGTEAAAAIVEFMTQYEGLYCIITAGYEREMTRYFLPQRGLSRRFPNVCTHALTPEDMILVFRRQLMRAQGYPITYGEHEGAQRLPSDLLFSEAAYEYIRTSSPCPCRGTTCTRTRWTARRAGGTRACGAHAALEHVPLEHQAGAMANLADEAVTVLYTTWARDVVAVQSQTRAQRAPAASSPGRADHAPDPPAAHPQHGALGRGRLPPPAHGNRGDGGGVIPRG